MHGLTGGDWKRSRDQRKPRQSPTLLLTMRSSSQAIMAIPTGEMARSRVRGPAMAWWSASGADSQRTTQQPLKSLDRFAGGGGRRQRLPGLAEQDSSGFGQFHLAGPCRRSCRGLQPRQPRLRQQ